MIVGEVREFPGVRDDKDQALKPLEEASEIYTAWKEYQSVKGDGTMLSGYVLDDLANEIADCITACCNLAAAVGIDSMKPYVLEVEERNIERGRYASRRDTMPLAYNGDAPEHYRGDGYVTCDVAMRSMTANAGDLTPDEIWWWRSIAKYVWRWPYKKQAKEDLEKARDCIDKLMKELDK